ncbi:DamX protein [Alteromonadaceae bacterium Bs31]|nr:DamX protein [Alteromonadaceae bacterium Bs31]
MENQELDLTTPENSSPEAEGDFFLTPARQGLIDQLVHLLQFGEGIPVLVGAAGAGKSRFLTALRQQLSHLEFSPHVTIPDDLELIASLSLIATRLGIQIPAEATAGEVLAILRHFSASLANEQQQGVVLIDNADKLDDSTLGALVSLLQGHEDSSYGLHLLFASRPGLVERLDAMQLIDVPVYDFDMPLLSAKELGALLKELGLVVDGSAESEIVRNTWARSLGNPGLAIPLVSNYSMGDGVKQSNEGDAKAISFVGLPIGHIVAMGLLVLVLGWALLSRDSNEADGIESVPLAKEAPVVTEIETAFAGDGARQVPGQPASEAAEQLTPAKGDGTTIALVREPVEELYAITPEPSLTPTRMPTQMPVSPPVSKLAVRPTAIPSPLPLASPAPKPQTVREHSSDEAFLLSTADTKYSLQVLAASKRESLEAYIQRQPNKKDLYLYQGLRQGKSWYVVLAGVYSSREAAVQARSALPSEQRKAGPWPRSLKDIKQEINENRRK